MYASLTLLLLVPQASEHRSALERLQRDHRSLSSELTQMKEELGNTINSKGRVNLMSLAAMEKIQVGAGGVDTCIRGDTVHDQSSWSDVRRCTCMLVSVGIAL